MKTRLLLLTVATLSACAPAVVETPVKASRSYAQTCAAALNAVQDAGLQIRPTDGWNTYHVVSASPERVLLVTELRFTSASATTSSVWTCAESAGAATLTVSTTGLRGDVADNLHRAFFSVLDRP